MKRLVTITNLILGALIAATAFLAGLYLGARLGGMP